ncbi:MAG TPA: hypothetical protein VGY66_12090 [Gemmataceae bacterium]|nr:hypothetical protein [Gemmataceae bacterium]
MDGGLPSEMAHTLIGLQQSGGVSGGAVVSQLSDLALAAVPARVGSFGTSAVISLQLQAGLNANAGTNTSLVVEPISESRGRESSPGSSWTTLMDEIRETLLLGVSDARAVFDTLGAVRSARQITDEVFASPDSREEALMFAPVATPDKNASYDATEAPGAGSDRWIDWLGADEAEGS